MLTLWGRLSINIITIIPHPALSYLAGWWAWLGPHCGPYGKSEGTIFKQSRAFKKKNATAAVSGLPPWPECMFV